MILSTKKVYPPTPQQPVLTLDFVKPLSYEFRVVEMVDSENKITKVNLQAQIWEHDEFGIGSIKRAWFEVPRVKMDASGNVL